MAMGGKRKGAGRPKGSKGGNTLLAEKGRQYILERVARELGPLMDALITKAKTGDTAAIKDLFDRAYGKPKETVEHQGDIILKIDI